MPERGESICLIQSAFELGCTFFDTAEGYGAGGNERLVGEAVKPFRHKIVLATKLHLNKRDGDTDAVIRGHLEASLNRLGTDYVDLYYQHRIEDDDKVEEVAEVMGELIKEGKIRGWGQSQATEDQVRRANAVIPLSAIQSEFSKMERMFEKDVIPACEELGIGFVPFSPLASGFLSGKYTKEQVYTGDDVRRVITRFAPENMERFEHFAFQEVVNEDGQQLLDENRFMAILAALMGCQGIDEFKIMLPKAMDAGLSAISVKEIICQAVDYLGIGRVQPFLTAANEVLMERGEKLPLPGQATTTLENHLEKGVEVQTGHINRWLVANCFGDYYTRTGLDLAQREMIRLFTALLFRVVFSYFGYNDFVRQHSLFRVVTC